MCKYLGSWKCHRTVFSLMAVSNSLFYINTDVHIDILKANIKISSQTGFLCALWIKNQNLSILLYQQKKKLFKVQNDTEKLSEQKWSYALNMSFFLFLTKGIKKGRTYLDWVSVWEGGGHEIEKKNDRFNVWSTRSHWQTHKHTHCCI